MISAPALLAPAVGLVLGSFAVTAGQRLGRGESLLGRSRCDECRRSLTWRETLPLVSFVAAGGSCGGCAAPISRLHPLGEVAGLAVVLAALQAGDPVRAALIAALGLLLVALSACDWVSRRLPDPLTALAAGLAFALALHAGGRSVLVHAAIAAAVAAVLLALRLVSARGGRDPGLGLGDVKLLAGLALWLGPLTPWAVAVAAGLGLLGMALARPADGRLPFGPFIALGAWGVGLAGEVGAWPMTT